MDAAQKAKFEQRMVLVLLVIFAAALFNTLKRLGVLGGQGTPRAPQGALATTVQQLQRHEEAVQQVEQSAAPPPAPVVEYTAEDLRDPLRSLLARPAPAPPPSGAARRAGTPAAKAAPGSVPKPPEVTIHGIIVGERPQAIIDRTLYEVGDTVKGVARIVAIDRAGVTMEVQGFRFLFSPTSPATLVNRIGGER